MMKDHQEQCWNIDTTEDVEMSEVRLGNADQLHQGVLHRTIQGLPIPEELQYKQWKIWLSEADDAVVDDHEAGEEDQNSPDDVYINVIDDHFISEKPRYSMVRGFFCLEQDFY